MPVTTISSRTFQQKTSEVQKAARTGPVIITNRDRPVHVLLSYETYQRLAGMQGGTVDALAGPGMANVDEESSTICTLPQPAEYS